MAQVSVIARKEVHGSVDAVRAALADYDSVRPTILTDHYSEYRVEAGGRGAGSQVHWKLAATEKRVRDQLVDVTESSSPEGQTLVESDRNSSMVTTWTVRPSATEGSSTVEVHTTWNGAGGIGGFFERTFAPAGLRRIHEGVLTNLDDVLRSS
jgi:polyketide cyclase/dehydrase/lipid transport protein